MRKIISIISFILIMSSALLATTKANFVYSLPNDVGLVNIQDSFVDLPTASTSTILASVSISTQSLVASATTYTLANGDITDVIFPRNIVADMYFAVGESTTVASGTLTVTGYDQFGRLQAEALTVSTNSVTGSIAWSNITQLAFSGVTISSASQSTVNLSVGMGTKIALSNNIGDSADIIKVIETGLTSTTYTVDEDYDTIIFADAPDASSDYYVYYNARTNKNIYKY